jgi:hypothetical protein
MRIVVHRVGQPERTFAQWAEELDLTMHVSERMRDMWHYGRYYASFRNVEISERGLLVSASGNGDTPEEAIEAYANALVGGRRLVIDAYKESRREVVTPNEWVKP